ncbi:MAG: hypothetical protein QOG65_2516, partial [Actinomycetota bacterium]|nr:hypothetical protein [Actinomycetota bacterium]
MEADETRRDEASAEIDRATRLAKRRGSWRRRAVVTAVVLVVIVAGATGTYAVVSKSQKASGVDQGG